MNSDYENMANRMVRRAFAKGVRVDYVEDQVALLLEAKELLQEWVDWKPGVSAKTTEFLARGEE